MGGIVRAVAGAAASVAVGAALLVVAAPPVAAQAAPDGRIVYVAGTGAGTNTTYEIHVVNADGTGDVNISNTPDAQELDPVWSPDGTRIAFISNRVTETNPDGNYEVFAMDADGANVTQLTFANPVNDWEFWQSYDPDWSPDGTRIVFSGYRDPMWGSELFIVPTDGSGTETHITNADDQANKWEPDWSPDGSTILFTWGWDAYSQDLRTIDVDGTDEVNLFPDTVTTSERNPAWSPDGTRIAFRSDTLSGGGNVDVWVMEYPSRVLTRVTDDPATDESPAWSPDGSQIIFSSSRGAGYDLYVVDAPPVPPPPEGPASLRSTAVATADGASRLTTGAGDEQEPNWDGAGATDTAAPRTLITRPRNGQTYERADLTKVRGSAMDDTGVTRVQVALRRNNADGSTSWWSGSAWLAGRADRPLWRAANGTSTWSLRLPTLASTAGSDASYTVMSRAGDAAGNVESTLRAGRNQATFEIA